MYNFLASCGLCSSNPTPGDYAYEAYTKIRTDLANQSPQTPSDRRIQPQTEHLINTAPKRSVIAGDYTFKDLVNDNPREVYVRKIMKSSYAQLIKAHEESGRNFIDREFPPQQSSIGDVEDLRVRATWKRIPDIIKDLLFVEGRIEPIDIFQGSLGDCYFLSAIAALAEKDFRIKNLFPELRLNKNGIYMARIYYRGVLREVVVDDYIPVNQQGDPLFAKPAAGRSIWVMILEKCWAKLHGSYGAMIGGLPNEVLHSLSGAPTYYHEIPSDKLKRQELWATICNAYQKGAIFCCGTKGQDRVQQYGLSKGHAYTLLQVFQNPYRMVKLRNPWGNREWQGRAAQRDWQFWSAIPPADRQALGYNQQNSKKGIFFMLWDDFVNFYDMVDICHINDNASYSSCQELFSRKSAQMFEFETEGGNLTLTLSQDQQRSKKKRIFSRSMVIVGRQEEQSDEIGYKYITSSTSNSSSEHYLELNELPKGKYVVYCKIRWIDSDAETATLSVYTGSPLHLATIKQSKHKQFLFQVFLDHARNNPKKQIIGQGEWICNDLLLNQCGYGYLAFHLDTKSNRKLGIQISQSDYIEKRFVLKKPYRGRGSIKTSLSPGKELIVLFHIKSQNLPTSVTLPVPKIYNLV